MWGRGHGGRRAAMEQRCEYERARVHPCINDDVRATELLCSFVLFFFFNSNCTV